MKLDRLIRTHLLGRPYRQTDRRFEEERPHHQLMASIVVAHVLDMMPVHSVVDVGCGAGFWLKAFSDRGVDKLAGVDGDYTNRSRLQIDERFFSARDLNQPLTGLGFGRFDLAMSLEVAEHLLPDRAESLVNDLCGLSDFVMFGAAIPKQGGLRESGEQHINEQWQSYWVDKFASRGYLPYDVLRPLIWNRREVYFWYKQNTILYVRRGSSAHAHFEERFPSPTNSMFDLVHPDCYAVHLNAKRGFRRLHKNLKRIIAQVTGLPPHKPQAPQHDAR